MSELTITPLTITIPQLQHCLTLYPKIIQKHYASKMKDSKKVNEAVKRDKWRYDELPPTLGYPAKKGMETHMTLEQLGRLVQWKITHGHSRPFLPAMIRKNDAKTVKDTTSFVAGQLADLSHEGALPVDKALVLVLKALDHVSKLSGVGPATASLILSVYDPINVPFFEDEMFNWVSFDLGKAKLKYDKKEYSELFKRVWKMRERLETEVSAVQVEKASFVLEHWDLVDEKDQDEMPEFSNVVMVTGEAVTEGGDALEKAFDEEIETEAAEDAAHERIVEEAAKKREGASSKRGTKRGTPIAASKDGKAKDSDSGPKRSKRVKK